MSGIANPGANFIGRRLHVQQAGNLIEIEPVQLEALSLNFFSDSGENSLQMNWSNPTAAPGVPVGIRIVVKVDDLQVLNTVLPNTAHTYVAEFGIGVYEVTLTNKGNGTIYLDSDPITFGGLVIAH